MKYWRQFLEQRWTRCVLWSIPVGILVTWILFRVADYRMRQELLHEAAEAARSVDFGALDRLKFEPATDPPKEYGELSRWMRERCQSVRLSWTPANRWVSIYTMKRVGEAIRFGPESIPAGDPASSSLGMIYHEPPGDLLEVFQSVEEIGRAHV